MKRISYFVFIFLHVYQIARCQFKMVGHGFSHPSQAIIVPLGGIRMAGGGVILRGESKPKKVDEGIMFYNSSITEDSKGLSNIDFQTSKCNVNLKNYTWLIRDAVMLVKNEKPNEINRIVDLLGAPDSYEEMRNYPPKEWFYTEVDNALINTKSGEMFLLVDILQTDVSFYSKDTIAQVMYLLALESLLTQCENCDYSDWTYNDQDVNYTFSCSCLKNQLVLEGRPHFTYLQKHKVNNIFTNYFNKHKDLIVNLRKKTMSDAENFARIAAFFRYLKKDNTTLWSQIVDHYQKVMRLSGNTPRTIAREK